MEIRGAGVEESGLFVRQADLVVINDFGLDFLGIEPSGQIFVAE